MTRFETTESKFLVEHLESVFLSEPQVNLYFYLNPRYLNPR